MTEKRKGQPLAIHKNYIIRGIKDAPGSSTTKELLKGLGCSTPDEAINLLKEFPGDWIIRGQLLSHDSPELPKHLRKVSSVDPMIEWAHSQGKIKSPRIGG